MVAHPVDLGGDDAEVAGPLRDLEPAELLHRQRVADVVHDRRDVVETVGVGEHLGPGDVLAGLLEAAVQEADVQLHAVDGLAVELDHRPHRPVHGRVAGAEVDVHPLRREGRVEGARRRGHGEDGGVGGLGHVSSPGLRSGRA